MKLLCFTIGSLQAYNLPRFPPAIKNSPIPMYTPCNEARNNDLRKIEEAAKNNIHIMDFFPAICQKSNDDLYAPKKYQWRSGMCNCIDPLSGDVESTNFPCDKPCVSEPGNTCKEQRQNDLDFMNNSPRIQDFFPVQCQKDNSAFWVEKEWTWRGSCICKNMYTGKHIITDHPCEFVCPQFKFRN